MKTILTAALADADYKIQIAGMQAAVGYLQVACWLTTPAHAVPCCWLTKCCRLAVGCRRLPGSVACRRLHACGRGLARLLAYQAGVRLAGVRLVQGDAG